MRKLGYTPLRVLPLQLCRILHYLSEVADVRLAQ